MLTYQFGDVETTVKKLVRGFAAAGDGLRVYEAFAQRVQDHSLDAYGVNRSWQLAIRNVSSLPMRDVSSLPGAAPMLNAIMNMNIVFEEGMTSLIDDNADFLAEVVAAHTKIMQEASS